MLKKLAPFDNPEYAFWAIAPDGTYLVDKNYMYSLGVDENILNDIITATLRKLQSYENKYSLWNINVVKDKIVFLVDDGIATGFTAVVAGKYLKKLGARKVILAVPVCPLYINKMVIDIFDDIICINPITNFSAVSQWYLDFPQVEDDEYFELMKNIKITKNYLKTVFSLEIYN